MQHKRICAKKINNPSTGAKRVMGFFSAQRIRRRRLL